MPAFEYDCELKVYAKACSTCKQVFHGTNDQEESEKLLWKFFDQNKSQADGFQNVCKTCFRMNRRRRNGVADHNEKEMFEAQNGKCAICLVELHMPYRFSADPQGARVDHDHATGRVRGLLCHACNTLLGLYEAILQRHPGFDFETVDKYIRKP